MIKDLMHAIFNEDVDVDEDEMELEAVERKPVETVIETPKETFVKPQIQTKTQPINLEIPAFTEEKPIIKQTKSSFFSGLDVDDISSDDPTPRHNPKKPYKFDRKKAMKVRRVSEEVEYQQIISPIFGNTEESKKEFNKIHDAITLPKPENDEEGFVQIISPMYGNDVPGKKSVKSIPKVEVESKQEDNLTLKELLEKPKKTLNQQQDLFSNKD